MPCPSPFPSLRAGDSTDPMDHQIDPACYPIFGDPAAPSEHPGGPIEAPIEVTEEVTVNTTVSTTVKVTAAVNGLDQGQGESKVPEQA